MIPQAYITHWRASAPWLTNAQVEQDLVLSRAIVELFQNSGVSSVLAFRGGTALHKLYLAPPGRYSEDLDFVQTRPGPIGEVLSQVRATLDPWLGQARFEKSDGGTTLRYRFESEIAPVTPLRVKIEINTREQDSVSGVLTKEFALDSPWFSGRCKVKTYSIEELLGTKLRALYQRKKGRDLFDLWLALSRVGTIDPAKVIRCFTLYLKRQGHRISRAEFEANLAEKRRDPDFARDIRPLLSQRAATAFDPETAFRQVQEQLISRLPGKPWQGA